MAPSPPAFRVWALSTVFIAGWWELLAIACSEAPDCTALRRKPCDPRFNVPNVCGECLPGAHGITGHQNSICLSNASCGVVFPGQAACTESEVATPQVPFIVPFGICACDDGSGLQWKTAPGNCAKVFVSLAGQYALQECTTRTCEASSCTTVAEWLPFRPDQNSNKFECTRVGADTVTLSDGCKARDTGAVTDSALCGHPGMIASRVVSSGDFAVVCQLAPRCPESVLGGTRLDQSCCNGNLYSHPISEAGKTTGATALGFCSIDLQPGEECTVRSIGPGWRGCSCLNGKGQPRPERQCTVECEPPACPLPRGGIPRTPEAWLTSAVPAYLWRADQNRIRAVSSAAIHSRSGVFIRLQIAAATMATTIMIVN